MKFLVSLLVLFVLWMPRTGAQTPLAIIPQPVSVTPHTGRFQLTSRTVIVTDPASVSIGHQLARYLEPATGFTLAVQATPAGAAGAILLRRDATLKRLGPPAREIPRTCD